MKRNIITLLFAVFAMAQTVAQTYDNLWKQAEVLRKKDQPRSELAIMQKIVNKATLQKDYGQLLAAELQQAMLWNAISPDSLAPAIKRMEAQAHQATDPVLKAVRYATLGKLYRENSTDIPSDEVTDRNLEKENEKKSAECFKKALAEPALLAKHYSTEYVPLTLKGMDGATFNNDILHLIGFEADTKEAYQLMHTYYNKVGNRGAACLCAFEITQKDRQEDVKEVRKSKYLNTIDSLIHVYQDIPEAGELAVEHYRFMEGATDAKPADKLNYINYALNRWGGWSRMNVLRNAQKRLTESMFRIEDMPQVLRPSQKQWVHLQVRNLQNLKIAISRINITADNDYDVSNDATYKMLLKKTSSLHQKDLNKQFYGHPNYEEVKDSFLLGDMPLGAYLMEVSSDNADIAPQRKLFYVSDLAVMIQQLPDDSHRYVVVNATSGQPIAGAKIELYDDNYDFKTKKNKRTVHARLTTDENGEASFKNMDGNVLIFTSSDQYMPAQNIYLSRTRYYERKENSVVANVYTDRAIYRPGQTVHATAVLAICEKGLDAKVCPEGKVVKFKLRDANWKVVSEKQQPTDAYGTASVDFELPQGGLTGQYSVQASGEGSNGSRYFHVEEYKRPTFEVTFPKVNEKYTWGDTVVVKATAKTYAGVPVQGAKVEYKVTRRSQLWWWGGRSADKKVFKGEGVTREDGTFDVEIPLEAAVDSKDNQGMTDFMRKARFFNFDVSAIVTDISGESHEGEMSLPLGTKPTAFSADLPKRIEQDSLKNVTFSYRNSAGMEITSGLKYRIDKGVWVNAEANTPILIKETTDKQYAALAVDGSKLWLSGVHELEAICGQDTLAQKFTLFSMQDTHPMEPTTHWYYQTADVFPRDGKPVYVQVGSSENGAHIVYSIIAGNKLIEKGAWELGDSIVTLPFTYKEEYASGIVINYSFVKEGKCYANMMRIARPLPEKKLNLAWKTFRNRLTPGQKEEWTLQITTPDGKPAKAQLMSVLYDKSLDKLQNNLWNMSLGLYQTLPNCYWKSSLRDSYRSLWGFGATYPTKYYDENELDVDHLNDNYFGSVYFGSKVYYATESVGMSDRTVDTVRYAPGIKVEKHSMQAKELSSLKKSRAANANLAVSSPMAGSAMDELTEDVAVGGEGNKLQAKVDKSLDNVLTRENLNETAFFYPALESDNNGNVAIKFTLPESITTWKFMGLAHDKEMRNGALVDEAVAKKTVMVQPNMPRFLREGDKATIVTKVFNTSDKKVSGNARMQLIDPETNKVIWQQSQKYSIDANGSAILNFDVAGLQEGIYINKVVAAGNGYSDGEQHYLPVLSNRELVTNTLPFTLTEKGSREFDLTELYLDKAGKSMLGKDGKQDKAIADAKVTIEYTNNPSWMMIQALPTVSNPSDDNAISLMSAIYSNSIARHIMQSSPVIKQVVELWKQENASASSVTTNKSGSSLMSNLEKNQELKNIILNETPWVMDADKESEQKAKLVSYFDESQNANRLASQTAKLKTLQNHDGSFSWWKGMAGSRYMTTAIAKMMVRLNKMVGTQTETANMLTSALSYLQRETAKEVREMKKEEEKAKAEIAKAEDGSMARKNAEARLASIRPSETAVEYLYVLSLDGRKQGASATADVNYLVDKMANRTCEFTIYGKAQASVILSKHGKQKKAAEYLQSINEYSVSTPEMGRYFDTRKAYYSWSDYKIPTQVAAIEAIKSLPVQASQAMLEAKQTVAEMQLWLLQSKRTQAWDTPINTVDAVYAFMDGNVQILNKTAENASLKLDGKVLDLPKATAGLGYVKTTKQGVAKTLTVDKKNEGTSWGAVYAQFTQPSSEIASSASGIKVSRKVENVEHAKVGDKVKVILTIAADRDYDFVQIVDKRAACLEPVGQLSGYQWGMGCYVTPKDNATNFYFDRLSKGKHTVEMEYYVDRMGEYQAGSCSAQCAYSPEFAGRTEAYQMKVSE